jgi:acyl carrier protein phosphodiesterase
MEMASTSLEENYEDFENEFNRFFPELQAHSQSFF